MESIIVLMVLATLVAIFGSPLLALFAWRRVKGLERRVLRLDAVEAHLARLESRLSVLERASRSGAPATEPARPVPAGATEPSREPARGSSPEPDTPIGPERKGPGGVPPRTPRPADPAPAATVTAPAPPAAPRPGIEWERWLGIRGAAVLGALALALAGLLFFKYSIERGLITPTMRVVSGTLTGLACIVGSRALRARGYGTTGEGVAGAGVVILYAALWAAHVLYGLIGIVPAFALMLLVTVTCCLLAARDASLLVAVLGLVGGFATPLLLSSGADRPIGLFGYVLLLDVGLLAVGHRRRWASLGALSLLSTLLLQGLWIGIRMGPDRLLLGLAILAVFSLLFVVAGRFAGEAGPLRSWVFTQAGAIFFPFAFATYFAARAELGLRLLPIALLLALLSVAAGWLARERQAYSLGLGAAVASVGVCGVWLLQHASRATGAWELAVVAAGLSLVFHAFVEWDRSPRGLQGPGPAALMAAAGFFGLLLAASTTALGVHVWPFVLGWGAIAALLYRHAAFPERSWLQVGAAAGLGIGLSLLHVSHAGDPRSAAPSLLLGVLVGAALVLHGVARSRGQSGTGASADRAAATLPAILLLGLAVSPLTRNLGAWPALGTAGLLGVSVLVAATRLRAGRWYAAAVAATALAHAAWTWDRLNLSQRPSEGAWGLVLQAGAVALFTGWLFVARRQFGSERWARWTAALASLIWFPQMKRLYEIAFGSSAIGLLPVALGALSLGAVMLARRTWPSDEPARFSAVVWFSAVALGFLSIGIPLQLEKEWITIGWALEGLAVIVLWKRLDHAGLKYCGLLLLSAVTVRLVTNPAVLGYYPRSGVRVFNWVLYTYIVPAAALLCSAAVLRPLEVARWGERERAFYVRPRPFGAILTFLAAVVVLFVWLNLAVADWFATGPRLVLSFGATPGQRLTVSIAWALYALALLGFGMSRGASGLRWVSLAFLLFTIGKVFLFDLGALEDLYRVASLVGLAASLILVSLLYQRYVFRDGKRSSP